MVGAHRRLPGEPCEGIVTLAGQMGVADATATKPPHPRPPPLYAQNDNSEPSARANQRTGTAAHIGRQVAVTATPPAASHAIDVLPGAIGPSAADVSAHDQGQMRMCPPPDHLIQFVQVSPMLTVSAITWAAWHLRASPIGTAQVPSHARHGQS